MRHPIPNGEPPVDWRTQMTPDIRSKVVNRIMETLEKHLQFDGPDRINEIRRIASKFEEKIFNSAYSQMLSMEAKDQRPTTSSNHTAALESGTITNNQSCHASKEEEEEPKEVPTIETNDWRTEWTSDSRSKVVNKIMETLKKHRPFSGPEGINEVRRIASQFEEKIFNSASSQRVYLGKISVKMLTYDAKSQNTGGSSSYTPAANNGLPLDPGHLMDNGNNSQLPIPKEEPAENTDDWRTQLPPGKRQKNASKIAETLEKHVPNSGEEGTNELMRIAASFEELIFNTAIDQVDYFRKISFKMQNVEERE